MSPESSHKDTIREQALFTDLCAASSDGTVDLAGAVAGADGFFVLLD